VNLSKNISLIIAITIPILATIFIAVSIYLPRALENPKYNFLYTTDYSYQYRVEGNILVNDSTLYQTSHLQKQAKLYIYNVSNNQSTEISLEEAQNLYLDSSSVSSDGFQIITGNQGGLIFRSSDYSTWYLQGQGVVRKLNIQSSNSYNNRFTFLGWIIKQNG